MATMVLLRPIFQKFLMTQDHFVNNCTIFLRILHRWKGWMIRCCARCCCVEDRQPEAWRYHVRFPVGEQYCRHCCCRCCYAGCVVHPRTEVASRTTKRKQR